MKQSEAMNIKERFDRMEMVADRRGREIWDQGTVRMVSMHCAHVRNCPRTNLINNKMQLLGLSRRDVIRSIGL